MAIKVEISTDDVRKVVREFKKSRNFSFENYAEMSFKRRIEYLLVSHNLSGIDELLEKTRNDSIYFRKCINDITVNTTELFRDADVWLNLRRNVLPALKDKSGINIWHAGCSSGEEVFSMLILLNEMNLLEKAKVFATDINTEILHKARNGVFNHRFNNNYFQNFDKVVKINPLNYDEKFDVPYDKYFEQDELSKSFRIKKFLRDKVTFKYHNLTEDSVFYKFDIIFCRNVIIYFNTELQNKVISLLHESLFKDGILLIGVHENIAYLPVGSKFESRYMKGLYVKK
ncbi:MAG: protein-glutamate O-methyltransferase CheR [Bacteroidetes bacterium]|nr:MAG: protein-glutamate O-methyltransferase CheR [Bacteroidota bacterium]